MLVDKRIMRWLLSIYWWIFRWSHHHGWTMEKRSFYTNWISITEMHVLQEHWDIAWIINRPFTRLCPLNYFLSTQLCLKCYDNHHMISYRLVYSTLQSIILDPHSQIHKHSCHLMMYPYFAGQICWIVGQIVARKSLQSDFSRSLFVHRYATSGSDRRDSKTIDL
jgi:hypothetical protein